MHSFKSIYAILFLLTALRIEAQISDKRLCVDEECKVPVSKAKTLLRYSSPDPRILSFSANSEVTIYSKEAGKDPSFWGAEINGKRGYIPKTFVREIKVLKTPSILVDTELSEQPKVETIQPQKVQEPFEVVDGTTIYLSPTNEPVTTLPIQSSEANTEASVKETTEALSEVSTDDSLVNNDSKIGELNPTEELVKILPSNSNEANPDKNIKENGEKPLEVLKDDSVTNNDGKTVDLNATEEPPTIKSLNSNDANPEDNPMKSDENPLEASKDDSVVDNVLSSLSNMFGGSPEPSSKENESKDEDDDEDDDDEDEDESVEDEEGDETVETENDSEVNQKSENSTKAEAENELKIDLTTSLPPGLNIMTYSQKIEKVPEEIILEDTSKEQSNSNEAINSKLINEEAKSESKLDLEAEIEENSSESEKIEDTVSEQSSPLINTNLNVPKSDIDLSSQPSLETTNQIKDKKIEDEEKSPVSKESVESSPYSVNDLDQMDPVKNPEKSVTPPEILPVLPTELPAAQESVRETLEDQKVIYDSPVSQKNGPEATSAQELASEQPTAQDLGADPSIVQERTTEPRPEEIVNEVVSQEAITISPIISEEITEPPIISEPISDSKYTQETIINSLNPLESTTIIPETPSELPVPFPVEEETTTEASETTNPTLLETEPVSEETAEGLGSFGFFSSNSNSQESKEFNSENQTENVETVPAVEPVIETSNTENEEGGFFSFFSIFSSSDQPETVAEQLVPEQFEPKATCEAQNCQFDYLEQNETEDAKMSFNFKSDIFLYLITTAVSIILFLIGYLAIDKNKREGPLVARINKLEKELLISLKENEMLQERRGSEALSEYNPEVSSEIVDKLCSEIEELKTTNANLEDQIQALEKELDTSTEVGMELNRIVSEMLSSSNASETIKSNVEQLQRQLVEQQATINSVNEALQEAEEEKEKLKLTLDIKTSKVADLQNEVDKLVEKVLKIDEERSAQLGIVENNFEELSKKYKEVIGNYDKLRADFSGLQEKLKASERNLELKNKEYENLKKNVNQMKLAKGGDVKLLFNSSEVQAELDQVKVDNQKFTEALEQERELRLALDKRLKATVEELGIVKNRFELAEKEKVEANTKLQVLNNYFKDKEGEMQKQLSKYESMWVEKEGEASTTTERIKYMQEELQNYKTQNDNLKQEILNQEVELKSQISLLEKKVNDNWLAARHTERKLEEARQEAAQLRNRLTLRERSLNEEKNNLNNNRMQSPIENGEQHALSPHPMDSPASPLLFGRDLTKSPPLPPFLPPPPGAHFMPPPLPGMPPFMPPPPAMFPGDHRPPPLGRMSSPPLNSRYSPESSVYEPYDRNSPSPPDSDYGGEYSPYNGRGRARDFKKGRNSRLTKGIHSGSDNSNDSLNNSIRSHNV